MERQAYLSALKQQVEDNVYRHSQAVEACMDGIYEYLKSEGRITDSEPPKEDWVLAGLIHDIDYGGEFKAVHPSKTKEALEKYGLSISDSVMHIIKAHAPDLTGVKCESLADWAIFCVDSLTGLITAVAYVYPSKKLAEVKVSSVLKRFLKEPKFAAGTRRNEVAMCENKDGLNIPLEKFIEISLESMKKVATEIGL